MNLQAILLSDNVVDSINENLDYLLQIIPEISNMIKFEHKHPHHIVGTIWDHVLLTLKISDNNNEFKRETDSKKLFYIRLALLLHDIGKCDSEYDIPDATGVRHYKGHPEKSEKIARGILQRLGYNEDDINYICYLIKYHDTPITDISISNNYEMCEVLYEVQRCDALAHHPDKLEKRKVYLNKIKDKLSK